MFDITEDYVFGEKYKIVAPGNTRITWEQARKNCQSIGPGWDLLKIQSRAEDLIIREMLKCELRGNIKSTNDNFYYQISCFRHWLSSFFLENDYWWCQIRMPCFPNKIFDKHNYYCFFCKDKMHNSKLLTYISNLEINVHIKNVTIISQIYSLITCCWKKCFFFSEQNLNLIWRLIIHSLGLLCYWRRTQWWYILCPCTISFFLLLSFFLVMILKNTWQGQSYFVSLRA